MNPCGLQAQRYAENMGIGGRVGKSCCRARPGYIQSLGSTGAGRDRAPGGRAWAHLRWARFACSCPLPLPVRPLIQKNCSDHENFQNQDLEENHHATGMAKNTAYVTFSFFFATPLPLTPLTLTKLTPLTPPRREQRAAVTFSFGDAADADDADADDAAGAADADGRR